MGVLDHIVPRVIQDINLRGRKMVSQAFQAFHPKAPIVFSPDNLHWVTT